MSKRILVIDDESVIRRSFALALEDSGYLVDTASSGEAGIEIGFLHKFKRFSTGCKSLVDGTGEFIYLDLGPVSPEPLGINSRLSPFPNCVILFLCCHINGEGLR